MPCWKLKLGHVNRYAVGSVWQSDTRMHFGACDGDKTACILVQVRSAGYSYRSKRVTGLSARTIAREGMRFTDFAPADFESLTCGACHV